MGPPETEPSALVLRYFRAKVHSENLSIIPKKPVTQSQKTAPGPPQ